MLERSCNTHAQFKRELQHTRPIQGRIAIKIGFQMFPHIVFVGSRIEEIIKNMFFRNVAYSSRIVARIVEIAPRIQKGCQNADESH